jgi:hypothetical protein
LPKVAGTTEIKGKMGRTKIYVAEIGDMSSKYIELF